MNATAAIDAMMLSQPMGYGVRLSGGRYRYARHIALLSERIAYHIRRGDGRLIVAMPPRHGKSETVSHYTPVWALDQWPEMRVILCSYEASFARSWGRKVRNTVQEHADVLRVRIAEDSQAAEGWQTTAGGGMHTAGAGGPITGKGADLLIVDDPFKNAEEADSPRIRDNVWEWWLSTARTRVEPGGTIIVVQTRWHEDDLVGRLLAQAQADPEADQWEVINLPAIAEDRDVLGREPGEALWPWRWPVERLRAIERSVGARWWNAMYQGRPSPVEGGILRRDWWRFYRRAPSELDEVIQSWDMSFKDTQTSDYVVGQVWGRKGADRYLLDQVRDRMDFPATVQAVRTMTAKWPGATVKLVEGKANGPAVIASLAREIPGLIEVEPKGSKTARAAAVSPYLEAGNVWIPDPTIAAWVHDFVEECAAFPNGAHDDQVDAMTQALIRFMDAPAPEIF